MPPAPKYRNLLQLAYACVVSVDLVSDAERLLGAGGSPANRVTPEHPSKPTAGPCSVLGLRGLGGEIWVGVSPEAYVRALREEWPAGE